MNSKPILFNAPMVRAVLGDSKTQTRRVFKAKNGGVWPNKNDLPGMKQILRECPYGKPGDQLWVRETFCPIYPQDPHYNNGEPIEYDYAATYEHGDRSGDFMGIKKRWKPSIHMPRWASRITLEITGVRVERLQEISKTDAWEEGCNQQLASQLGLGGNYEGQEGFIYGGHARATFAELWESINGTGSWEVNPWVWVVEFKRLES